MKKFYEEFFYVPKHGKVKEKVMLTRISISVVFMLLCMVVMSLSAYAYFSASTTVYVHSIQSAIYQLSVTPSGMPQSSDNVYTLSAGTYCFDISKTAEDTASVGFCEIRVFPNSGNPENYTSFYTEPIGTYLEDGGWKTVSGREVQIKVPDGRSVDVRFIAQWGTLSDTLTTIENETVDLNSLAYFADLDSSDSGENSEPPAQPSDPETNLGSSTDTVPDTSTDSSTDTSSTNVSMDTNSAAQMPSSTNVPSDEGTTSDTPTDDSSQSTSAETKADTSDGASEAAVDTEDEASDNQ